MSFSGKGWVRGARELSTAIEGFGSGPYCRDGTTFFMEFDRAHGSLNLSEEARLREGCRASEQGQVGPEYPRFVIQKHAATRLHYDLRLEFDGVFKSWAVTHGPSLDPQRSGWRSKSKTIRSTTATSKAPSQGAYGGGTVKLWDRGTWESDDPERELKKGDLKFTLHGDKMQGSWVLVRMRHDRNGGNRTIGC